MPSHHHHHDHGRHPPARAKSGLIGLAGELRVAGPRGCARIDYTVEEVCTATETIDEEGCDATHTLSETVCDATETVSCSCQAGNLDVTGADENSYCNYWREGAGRACI